MREDSGDDIAARAFDVHEERSWSWDEGLELVLASLSNWGGVEEIFCENHLDGLSIGKSESQD